MKCGRCEILPNDYIVNGTLYLVPPIEAVAKGLTAYLSDIEANFSEPYPGVYAIDLKDDLLIRLCGEYLYLLGSPEQRDTKSLIIPPGLTPSIQELVQMQPLSTLLARIQGQWLIEMLREDRITSYFQPIVSCNPGNDIYGYECLLRGFGSDGQAVSPGLMFEVARKGDLLFYLDRAARLSAIASAKKNGMTGKLFINFNPTSIYTPEYCLQTTLQAIQEAGIDHDEVVFEVVESDEVKDIAHLIKVVDFYRNKGFRIALDDLGAGYSSLNLLHRLRPDYIKIDMEIVRNVHNDSYKAKIASNILGLADDLGMITIAEGVENQREYEWFIQHGAKLAQGFLFGRPAPHAILAPTPPAGD